MSQLTILMICLFATGHAHNQDEALAKLLLALNPDAAFNPSSARSHLPASGWQTRVAHRPVMLDQQGVLDMMIDAYEKELPGFRHYLENGMAKEVALDDDFFDQSLPKDLTVAQAAENSGMSESTVEKLMKLISPEAEQEVDKKIEDKMEPLREEVKKIKAEIEGMDEESDEYKKKLEAMDAKVKPIMDFKDKVEKEAAERILAMIEGPIAASSKDYKGPPIKLVPQIKEFPREDPDEALKEFKIDDTVFDSMPAEAAKILDAYDGDKPKETLAEFLKLFDPFEQAVKA